MEWLFVIMDQNGKSDEGMMAVLELVLKGESAETVDTYIVSGKDEREAYDAGYARAFRNGWSKHDARVMLSHLPGFHKP